MPLNLIIIMIKRIRPAEDSGAGGKAIGEEPALLLQPLLLQLNNSKLPPKKPK